MVRRFLSFLHFDNNSRLAWFECSVYTCLDSNWIFGFIQRSSKQASQRENKKERIILQTECKVLNDVLRQLFGFYLFSFRIQSSVICRLLLLFIFEFYFYLHSETKCRFTHSFSFSLSISQLFSYWLSDNIFVA